MEMMLPSTTTSGAFSSLLSYERMEDGIVKVSRLSVEFRELLDSRKVENLKEEPNSCCEPREHDFGYNEKKEFDFDKQSILEKYKHLGHTIILVTLEKAGYHGLGINLCGHKNEMIRKTFICDVHYDGPACKSELQITDEILEVNGVEFEDLDYTEAAWAIVTMNTNIFKIVILRRDDAIFDLYFKPVEYCPKGQFKTDDYPNFLHLVELPKINNSIGIEVDEDYDEQAGWVHRITAVESFSAAERANIEVGHTIVRVNGYNVIDRSYIEVRALIAVSPDAVTLVICDIENGKDVIRNRKKKKRKATRRSRVYDYVPPIIGKKYYHLNKPCICEEVSTESHIEYMEGKHVIEYMEVDEDPTQETVTNISSKDDENMYKVELESDL